MVLKISFDDSLISQDQAQTIAKLMLEQAHDICLISVEQEIHISNEFIILSEDCALGFGIDF